MLRRQTASAVGVCAAGVALPATVLLLVGRHEYMPGSGVHFWGVGFGAILATVAALALTIVGWRRNDARTVLVGTAFSVMAALLASHGLATRRDHGLRGSSARSPAARRCSSARRSRARRAADRDRASEREPARRAPGHPDRRDRDPGRRRDARPERRPGRPRGRQSLALSLLAAACSSPSSACGRSIPTFSPAASPTSWSCSVCRSSPPRSSRRSSSTTCSSAGGSATASSFWASPSSGSRSQST